MVVNERTSRRRGRVVISVSLEEGGIRDPDRGERVVIHVNSRPWEQAYVAAAEAVREALQQLESQTGHIFPDYKYFKWKALAENDQPDVTQMPKRVSPAYESEFVSVSQP